MSSLKFITFKHNDSTFSHQWSELLDGKWPYGDLDEKIIVKDYNFYE